MNPTERPDELMDRHRKQGAIAMNENRKTELNTQAGGRSTRRPETDPAKKTRVLRASNAAADREKLRAIERKRQKEARKASAAEAASTRKSAVQKAGKEETVTHKRWVRIRLIPIWLRIIIVLFAIIAAAALGLMFGYGVLGDGKATDALKPDTWKHILDIIGGKE